MISPSRFRNSLLASDSHRVFGDRRRLRVMFALLSLLSLLAGCTARDIDSTYGKRGGRLGAASVNGTAVLSDMFEQEGCRIITRRRLSPRLERYDVIVWAPDDFLPPTNAQREFLEGWLANEPGRTLVYIGRDYTAAPDYWKKMAPAAEARETAEMFRRIAKLQSSHHNTRSEMPKEKYARWFTVRRDKPKVEVSELQGPWSRGVDASKTKIVVKGRLEIAQESDIPKPKAAKTPATPAAPVPPTATKKRKKKGSAFPLFSFEEEEQVAEKPSESEVLLQAGEDVLAFRVTDPLWGDSQIIVVVNGSFLLNAPLVAHEHRKLAAKLIAECGPPDQAIFLESTSGSLVVYDKEPGENGQSGFELFTIWPISAVLLHFTALGILYCFARYPIFGRPKELRTAGLSDFGKHVAAFGKLLERTSDVAFARSRVDHYHQMLKREEGEEWVPLEPAMSERIRVELVLPGENPPTAEQLALRRKLEEKIERDSVGKIVDRSEGFGRMTLVVEVSSDDASPQKMENLVTELDLKNHFTISIKSASGAR